MPRPMRGAAPPARMPARAARAVPGRARAGAGRRASALGIPAPPRGAGGRPTVRGPGGGPPQRARPRSALDVGRTAPGEQRAAWAEELGHDAGDLPGWLAGQFHLGRSAIRRIARVARCGGPSDPQAFGVRLWDACRHATRPRLEALAVRLEPRATWDDLVLPPAELALLRLVAVRARGRSTVYDGWGFRAQARPRARAERPVRRRERHRQDPGGGGAGAELRLDLYRIDLSAVVSKYIGETEKNLRRVFDAAEEGGAMLFFDEADALFGKRSRGQGQPRPLRQHRGQLPAAADGGLPGLAVLATNMRSALDQAFLRRLRFVVRVPVPRPRPSGAAIWSRAFPPRAPRRAGLDRLARLDRDRRDDPQHRAQRRVPRGPRRASR